MEFQDGEDRNDSLKLGFEKHPKKEKTKKRKKTKSQPPLATQLDTPEAGILEEMNKSSQETITNKFQSNDLPISQQA